MRYAELLKGLEISEYLLLKLENFNTIGAEYYSPEYLRPFNRLVSSSFERESLQQCCSLITDGDHGSAEYDSKGVTFVLSESISEGRIDLDLCRYITPEHASTLERSKLRIGDVLVTKTGVYFGLSAVVDEQFSGANTIAHVGILRPKGYIDPYFLSTFLNSCYGQSQLRRRGIKTSRPEIKLLEFDDIQIPKCSPVFQQCVRSAVTKSAIIYKQQSDLISRGESILLQALGLENWQPAEPLTYVRRASEVIMRERFDADHYQEKYYALASKLKECTGGVVTLGEICPNPINGVEIREYTEEGVPYLRVGDIKNYTVNAAGLKYVSQEAAEKEIGKVRLRKGDVLVSRSGSLAVTGVVESEWEHSVISSHLILVRIEDPDFNPHYVAAFLASMPGKMQIIQNSNGGVQPEINQPSLKRILIPRIPLKIQDEIIQHIRQAHQSRQEAQTLLEKAKRAVEIAIKEGEEVALETLN